jgi:outer membrane protein assembly factor BamE (lipoprotein component of BamABCDE complex)
MHSLFGLQTITISYLFLLLIATNGCMILPIPTPAHGGYGVITEESVESLESGKATRADVLLKLGDPAERLHQDRFFVYRWELTHGYLFVAFAAPGAGFGGPVTGDHFLLIEFLPDNRIKRFKFISPRIFHRTREQLDELIKEWSGSSSDS